jgi:hypothetical protein
MAALTRDQILEANDRQTVRVKVKEWAVNGVDEVIVSSMTGEMRDAWEQAMVARGVASSGGTVPNVRAFLLAYTIVDEDGNRIFSEDDIQLLGKKNALALQRCVAAASKLNGIGDSAVEEAQGNLPAVRDAAST